jgi:hypothetical protein
LRRCACSPRAIPRVFRNAGDDELTALPKCKKEKDVKSKTRNLALGCLAALGLLFAVSTPAQRFQNPLNAHPPMAASSGVTGSAAQQLHRSDVSSPDVTSACTYKFTSGAGATYLQFCVSVNGNIVEFESPAGVEQINQGGIAEGYGFCDQVPENGYYDYAYGDSGNWNAPVKLSQTATSVKIERTTSDGVFTLTQTFTSVAGDNPYAKILMSLKNNSAVTKGVALYRYADSDPGNAAQTDTYPDFVENGDGTNQSGFSYVPYSSAVSPEYGLMLQRVGPPTPASANTPPQEGWANNGSDGPAACDSFEFQTSPVTDLDDSIMYEWTFNIEKNQTVNVTSRYITF